MSTIYDKMPKEKGNAQRSYNALRLIQLRIDTGRTKRLFSLIKKPK